MDNVKRTDTDCNQKPHLTDYIQLLFTYHTAPHVHHSAPIFFLVPQLGCQISEDRKPDFGLPGVSFYTDLAVLPE